MSATNGQSGMFFNSSQAYVGCAQVETVNSDGTVDVVESHIMGRHTGTPTVSTNAHVGVEYVAAGGNPSGAHAYFQAT